MYSRPPQPRRKPSRRSPEDRTLRLAFTATFVVVIVVCSLALPHYVASWSWTKNYVNRVSAVIGGLIAIAASFLVRVLIQLIRKSRRPRNLG